MASLVLISKNTIDFNLVYSVQEFKTNFLSGLPLPESIDDSVLNFHLQASVTEIENLLSLKLRRQKYTETRDFDRDDWRNWGFCPTTYPVVSPISLIGKFGETKQIDYSRDWLSARKTSDDKSYFRQINVVPTTGSTHQTLYGGIMTQVGMWGSSRMPGYWNIEYITGWDNIPLDIINAIGMFTASKVLQLISDALMVGNLRKTVDTQGREVLAPNGSGIAGLGLGVGNKSISIDGLSQTYSTYVNGQTGIWGARLKQYAEMLDQSKPGSMISRLKDQYGTIFMGVA